MSWTLVKWGTYASVEVQLAYSADPHRNRLGLTLYRFLLNYKKKTKKQKKQTMGEDMFYSKSAILIFLVALKNTSGT